MVSALLGRRCFHHDEVGSLADVLVAEHLSSPAVAECHVLAFGGLLFRVAAGETE